MDSQTQERIELWRKHVEDEEFYSIQFSPLSFISLTFAIRVNRT